MPEVSGGLLESVVSFPGDENDDDTETVNGYMKS
jgi:hypothetical protein